MSGLSGQTAEENQSRLVRLPLSLETLNPEYNHGNMVKYS